MDENKYELSMLIDIYGELLSEKQRESVLLYYENDMSLGEVAAQMGISRQGVFDYRNRAIKKLMDAESKIGLLRRFLKNRAVMEEISQHLESLLKNLEKLTNDD